MHDLIQVVIHSQVCSNWGGGEGGDEGDRGGLPFSKEARGQSHKGAILVYNCKFK